MELSHGAKQQRVVPAALEHLDRAFFPELSQSFLQLLRLEWIARPRDAKQLGREVGHAFVAKRLAFGERIADLQLAMIVNTDDVAGDGVVA